MTHTINGITIDAFTHAYLVAALWASNDESTPSGGEPMDSNYDLDDIAPEAIQKAMSDCERFQKENAALLAIAYTRYSPHPDAPTPEHSAGHDFFLTRCGHGVGFWDRDELDEGGIGERLTEACKRFGNVDFYVGDDGRIYC